MRGTVAKRLRRQAAQIVSVNESVEAEKNVLMGRISKYVKDLKGNPHPRITAYYPKDHFRRIYRDLKRAHRNKTG